MKVTYIHHSAFCVELERVAMIFDYTEGMVPEIEGDKPLLVFASHRHGDHYSPAILEWRNSRPGIRYVLANDIWRKRLPEDILPITDTVKKGERLTYQLADGVLQLLVCESIPDGGIQVTTFRSTDEGVAFLIEAEGKRIYHAGDLNNWYWEGEERDWNERMGKRYSAEIDKMAGMHIDAAFLPLDPRQEAYFYLGMDEYLRKVDVAQVFPMHCWGDFSVIPKLKSMACAEAYRGRIVDIHQDGETFFC